MIQKVSNELNSSVCNGSSDRVHVVNGVTEVHTTEDPAVATVKL